MKVETIRETTNQAREVVEGLRKVWQEIEKLISSDLTEKQKIGLARCLDHIEDLMLKNLKLLKTNLNELKGANQ
jgi:hypothetical protein